MNISIPYIFLTIVVLAVVVFLVVWRRRNKLENRLSPLAGFAFAFIIASIIFSENRLVYFILLGIGLALAAADIIRQSRRE